MAHLNVDRWRFAAVEDRRKILVINKLELLEKIDVRYKERDEIELNALLRAHNMPENFWKDW
jgi:hypothetical protein